MMRAATAVQRRGLCRLSAARRQGEEYYGPVMPGYGQMYNKWPKELVTESKAGFLLSDWHKNIWPSGTVKKPVMSNIESGYGEASYQMPTYISYACIVAF